jgi:dihydropteridine reductase
MIHMNLDPVVASGFVAQHLMDPNGLMVVVGATAALQPTPGMMGYGLAKCASHHVVRTLGACTAKSIETKAIRQAGRRSRHQLPASIDTLTVVGILPTMIDTPANRRALLTSANANADASVVSQWTKPRDIAVEIGKWMECPDLRPHSGSLVKVRPSLSSSGQGGTTGAVFELVR